MTLDKLCPTRWTVRGKCYKKIIGTYNALFELWRHTLDEGRLTTDVKARIIGCYNQMTKFDFYFGLHLGQKFYSLTDNLSQALQQSKMSAISGQRLARLTISTIEKMRDNESAGMFFDYVSKWRRHILSLKKLSSDGEKGNQTTQFYKT